MSEHPSGPAKHESANLDVLRACAVGSVYFGHLLQLWDLDRVGPLSARAFAQTGVLVFFVHTSLVLMLSMERMPALSFGQLYQWFLVRRVFRIYPLSALTIFAVVAFSIPAFPTRMYVFDGWLDVAANVALIQNLTLSPSVLDPLWSLPYEVQMYLLLPVLFVLVGRLRFRGLIIVWLLSVLIATLYEFTLDPRLSVVTYAPCFISGVVGFGLMRGRRLALPVAGWFGIIVFAFGLRQVSFEAGWLGCLLLGMTVSHFRELGPGAIRSAAAWIARFSYGIYLSHVIVFWIAFVQLAHAPSLARWATCLVLSVLLPVAMYYGLEKPMIGAGARLADRLWAGRQSVMPARP